MTSPIDSLPPRPPLLTRLPPWTRRLALGLLVLAKVNVARGVAAAQVAA